MIYRLFERFKQSLDRLLTLSDLALFSITNLAITIFISRYFGTNALANYGVGLAVGLLFQSLTRNFYLFHNIVAGSQRLKRMRPGVVAEHMIMLYCAILLQILVGVSLELLDVIAINGATLYSGIYCTLLYVQADYDRFMLMSVQKKSYTIVLTTINTIGILGSAVLSLQFKIELSDFMLINIFLMIARSFVSASLIAKPNFRWARRLIKRDLRLRGLFALSSTLSFSGYNQIPLMLLATYSSPLQVAAFVAMRGLVQPTQMIIRMFDFRDKLTLRDKAKGSYQGLSNQVHFMLMRNIVFSGIIAIMCVVCGPFVSRVAYGSVYDGETWLTVGHSLIFATMALMMPMTSLINVMHLYQSNILWRVIAGVSGTILAVFLCARFGAWGALSASLTGWLIVLLGAAWTTRDVLFELRTGPLKINHRRP